MHDCFQKIPFKLTLLASAKEQDIDVNDEERLNESNVNDEEYNADTDT